MKTLFATRLASAGLWLVFASGVVLADPPPDKGNAPGNSQGKSAAQNANPNANPNANQGASQGNDKGQPPFYSNDAGRYDDEHREGDERREGKDASNHGQVVSDCNHRANQRDKKGQARKQWVEWCIDRGERHSYDDTRWDANRNCYQLADDRELSGDARRRYLHDCLDRADRDYDTSKDPTRGEPRGRDVLGKGSDR